jgi:hypothetical protein
MRWIGLTLLAAALACGQNVKDTSVQAMRQAEGFSWVERKSANFDFFVENGSAAACDLDFIVAVMETGRRAAENLLGSGTKKRMAVFIVPNRARMKQLTGREMNAFANGTSIFAYYESSRSYALGAHETLHNLALNRWRFAKSDGINEGFAVYADNEWAGLPLHLLGKWLLDHEKLLPLSELLKDGSSLPPDADRISYPELGSFVKFVYETYGRKAVKTLWQRGMKDRGALGGKTLLQVEAEWRAMLAKLDASALQYSL